ncbi:hypothetical protein, partial [Lunatimonas salinarum]|uniref:hypothetical protein n=1 Tax=Lunatimonas salinarum TaxID=1774590 RepID=UPI001ADFE9E0
KVVNITGTGGQDGSEYTIRGVNMLRNPDPGGSTCSGILPKIYPKGVNIRRNVSRIQPTRPHSQLKNIPVQRGQHAPEYPTGSVT